MKMSLLLLENGADIEAKDIGLRTPLFLAIKNDNKAMVNVKLLNYKNKYFY